MKFIDFRFRPHTRPQLESLAAAFKDMLLKGRTMEEYLDAEARPLDEIVDDLKAHDVMAAVITGRDIETTFGSASSNDAVKGFCEAYPDIFKGFVGADPHKGGIALKEIEHRILHEGFCGVSVDPMHARLAASDEKYYHIYELCDKLRVPVIITGGPSRFVDGTVLEHAAPNYLDPIARDFPNLKMIISHGAWPYVNEMIALAFRHRNVYMELSEYETFPMSNFYIEAANTIIPDKILFASAHPGVHYADALDLYEQLPFKEDVLENIMWKNGAKLLGLL